MFDDASIHMVEVGENSGTLDAVLEQLADFKQKQLNLKDSISTALAYPMFLVVFGSGAGLFLMTKVLPPLLENLEDTVDELPFPTRVAKAISDTVISYGWLLAILAILAVFGAMAMLRSAPKSGWKALWLWLKSAKSTKAKWFALWTLAHSSTFCPAPMASCISASWPIIAWVR